MKNFIKKNISKYLLIVPAMIGIFLFTVYPVIKLIILSFYKINMINTDKNKFVGIQNYENVFVKPAFKHALINTAVYSFFMIIIILICSLILAVWLGSKQSKSNSASQIAVFTPHIIAMVSVALIWTQMMDPSFGVLNSILGAIGLPRLKWLQSSDTSMLSIILVSSWKSIGYYTLIFIAALQSIPKEIYEAAELDNSSKISTFFKITLPMISPQIFFVLIVLTISSFKVFETIRVMTNGGPNNSTTSLVYLIYTEVMLNNRIGYGAAVGVVLLVIVSILTVLYFVSLSKKVYYQ